MSENPSPAPNLARNEVSIDLVVAPDQPKLGVDRLSVAALTPAHGFLAFANSLLACTASSKARSTGEGPAPA